MQFFKVSQYGGQICRYLLAQPEKEDDKSHKVRVVYGSGMHRNLAKKFRDRFKVQNIEYYGATEGTVNLGMYFD